MMEEQRNEIRTAASPDRLPEIYVFVNGRCGRNDVGVEALSEDGHFLAAHICSSPGWAPQDMGVTSDRKHDSYREHYPDGYAVVWIPPPSKGDPRIEAAYQKHLALAEAEGEAS